MNAMTMTKIEVPVGAGGFLGIYQTPSGEVVVTGSCFS